MENYYEILEVSPIASKEIIDKAYKTLAKKYHPDANTEDKKQWAEEKFKKINEAYETISDKEKRAEYDKRLEAEKEQKLVETENLKTKYQKLYEQNQILRSQLENLKVQPQNNTYDNNMQIDYNNIEKQINQKVTQSVNKAYNDAYIQRMRDYGYRIRYRKTFKERMSQRLKSLIAVVLVILILAILWQIPIIRNTIESNKVFQSFKNSFF